MMLGYKAWRESRIRFLLSAGLMVFLCVTFMIQARTEVPQLMAQHPRFKYSMFVWGSIYGNLKPVMFVILTMMLGLGGLQRERGSGTAAFTLSLPVSRLQILATRAAVGLLEMATLALIPALLVPTLSPLLAGYSYPATEALRFALLFIAWGAVAFAFAFLLSTFLTGEFTAVAACIVTPIVYKVVAENSTLGRFPLVAYESMSGYRTPYMDPSTDFLTGLPWAQLGVLSIVAMALLATASRVSQAQDF